jgi:hypothetical protein
MLYVKRLSRLGYRPRLGGRPPVHDVFLLGTAVDEDKTDHPGGPDGND